LSGVIGLQEEPYTSRNCGAWITQKGQIKNQKKDNKKLRSAKALLALRVSGEKVQRVSIRRKVEMRRSRSPKNNNRRSHGQKVSNGGKVRPEIKNRLARRREKLAGH